MWEVKNVVTLKVCISLIRKQKDTISNAELYKECLYALKQETQKDRPDLACFFFPEEGCDIAFCNRWVIGFSAL